MTTLLLALFFFCLGALAHEIFDQWETKQSEKNKVWKPLNRPKR